MEGVKEETGESNGRSKLISSRSINLTIKDRKRVIETSKREGRDEESDTNRNRETKNGRRGERQGEIERGRGRDLL